jgi:hypothetical protein
MKILSCLGSVVLGVCAVILFGVAFRAPPENTNGQPAALQLTGKAASDYLAQTRDGQLLMHAVTAARFGLRWQEHAPDDNKTGGGYLGMSHEQNLKAWFDAEGLTMRPTVAEAEREQAWSMALRLRAYGYGNQLVDVPPIVSRQVKENRIEYERASSNPKSAFRIPQLIEWYENKAAGIEQGFTLNQKPEGSGGAAPNEPLRLCLSLAGDLRARVVDEGEKIELVNGQGRGVLSYSKLVAVDADGKHLAARMEASGEGREIALVVDDAGARYPIVIDPIVASIEQKLRAPTPQAEARFGIAVAIFREMAVVGAWREDAGSKADVGAVYVYKRTNSTWGVVTSRN